MIKGQIYVPCLKFKVQRSTVKFKVKFKEISFPFDTETTLTQIAGVAFAKLSVNF